MMERSLEGKVAVITGNSRGIGRGISLVLAEAGTNIVGNHVRNDYEANATAEKTRQEIESHGVKSSAIVADIATISGRRSLLEAALLDYPEGIDYLFLNAAGGLGKSMAEAKAINVDAQLALVDDFLPHIRPRGAIIFLTSLWGQKHGEALQMPGYESVANTKKMVENALKDRIGEFDEKGIRLLIVCGHVVPGTQAYGYFMATNPGLITELEKTAEGGKFPTTEDMGRAARDLILSDKPSGSIAYVGGEFVQPLVTERSTVLGKEEVARKLSMYGESKLRIDGYRSGPTPESSVSTYTLKPENCLPPAELSFDTAQFSEDGKSGILRRTVQREEVEGHFVIDGEDEPVHRGVDLIKYATKAAVLQWKNLHPDSQELIFTGGVGYTFKEMAFPGNRLTFSPVMCFEDENSAVVNCKIKVGETTIAEIEGIEGKVVKQEESGAKPELIEAAAQALVLTWMDKNPTTTGVPIFKGGKACKFYGEVSAGDELTLYTIITSEDVNTVTGDCVIKAGDKIVAEICGIEGMVLPGMDLAREIIFEARAVRKAESKHALANEVL